jgi:prepilin-type N-terminal cleavage/methylation domain-containing protein
MDKQEGFSLVEMVVALAILTLVSSLAVWSATSLLAGAKMSREASRVADNVSLARERAIARSEQWMVEFPTPIGSSLVITSYTVKSCPARTSSCAPNSATDWSTKQRVTAEPGMGFKVTDPDWSLGPVQVIADQTGSLRPNRGASVTVQVCPVTQDSSGAMACRSSGGTTLQIHSPSGFVNVL